MLVAEDAEALGETEPAGRVVRDVVDLEGVRDGFGVVLVVAFSGSESLQLALALGVAVVVGVHDLQDGGDEVIAGTVR